MRAVMGIDKRREESGEELRKRQALRRDPVPIRALL